MWSLRRCRPGSVLWQIGVNLGYTFTCKERRGAVLLLREPAFETSVSERSTTFGSYMLDHYRSWLDFAKEQGIECSWDELILVRGTIKTTPSWAVGVYVHDGTEVNASFDVAGGQFASVGFQATTTKSMQIPFRHRIASTPSTKDTDSTTKEVTVSQSSVHDRECDWPEDAAAREKGIKLDTADQTVFLRCFMLTRKWYSFTRTIEVRAPPISDVSFPFLDP